MLVLPSIWRRSLWLAVEWVLLWGLCLAFLPTLAHAQAGDCALPGDVDQNGTVTPLDALQALQHYWIPNLNAAQQDCANVLNPTNSAITPADALCVFRRALGQRSCLDEMIPNRPPTLTDPGLQNTVESGGVVLPIAATDPDGNTLSYSAVMLPPGLTINPTTGRITGNLDATAVADNSYMVTVTVSDGTLSTQATFTWRISRAQISAGPCLCAGEPGDEVAISAIVQPGTESNLLRRQGPQRLVRTFQNPAAAMSCEFGVPVTFTLEGDASDVGDRPGGFPDPNGQLQNTVTVCPGPDGMATVPYVIGSNRVRSVQARLAEDPDPAPVRFTVSLGLPSGIVVEADNRIVVTDAGRGALERLDPASNERSIVSGCLDDTCSNSQGNGPRLFFPWALALDPTDATLVVIDLGENAAAPRLVRINPNTGNRTIISANSSADEVFFGTPVGIAIGADGTLFVVDRAAIDQFGFFSPAVLQVNPATGDKSVVVSNFSPGAAFFGFPTGIAIEPSGTLVVVDSQAFDAFFNFSPAIWRIDPRRGSRVVLSSNFSGGNLFFGSPSNIAMDISRRSPVLVVVDAAARELEGLFSPAILRVDPTTGIRQEGIAIPSNFTPQTEALFIFPYSVAIGADGALAVVDVGDFSTALPRVIRIEPDGSRRVIGGDNDRRGTGERFVTPRDLAVQANGTVWVLDAGLSIPGNAISPRVIRVDPLTGNRTVVSSNDTLDDVFFGVPQGIVVAADGSSLWVLDVDFDFFGSPQNPRVVRVDPESGDRTVVSINFNNDFSRLPIDIALDANGMLWVLDEDIDIFGNPFDPRVVRINPANGKITLVAFNSFPGNAFFGLPVGIAVTPDGRTVWIADANALNAQSQPLFGPRNSSVVWQVDPSTGGRVVRSSNGFGNVFFGPLLDIAIEPSGNLLVLDTSSLDLFGFRSPAIWRVTPLDGTRQLISSNRFLSPGFLAQPFGIALENANHLIAVDQLLGAVIRVDLNNCASFDRPCGERAIVSR